VEDGESVHASGADGFAGPPRRRVPWARLRTPRPRPSRSPRRSAGGSTVCTAPATCPSARSRSGASSAAPAARG
jgi:hypothetical protein